MNGIFFTQINVPSQLLTDILTVKFFACLCIYLDCLREAQFLFTVHVTWCSRKRETHFFASPKLKSSSDWSFQESTALLCLQTIFLF